MIKNNLVRIVATSAIFTLFTPLAFAANPDLPSDYLNPTGITPPVAQATSIWTLLNTIIKWTYTAFFILAVFFILLAAYDFLFAGGKPEMVKTARTRLLWAAVAIVVALLSVGASQIISSLITS